MECGIKFYWVDILQGDELMGGRGAELGTQRTKPTPTPADDTHVHRQARQGSTEDTRKGRTQGNSGETMGYSHGRNSMITSDNEMAYRE